MTSRDPRARRRSPFVTRSLVAVATAVASTAALNTPEPPGDPEVNVSTVDIADGALAGGTTLPVEVDGGPELVALTWRSASTAGFEVRGLDADGWSAWIALEGEPEEAPDTTTPEWTPTGYAGPVFLGRDVTDVELRSTGGAPTGLVLHAIDSEPVDAGDGIAEAAAPAPSGIISRQQWGADESWRDDSGGECDGVPAYSDNIQLATVHHTVGSNDYTPAESAAIIRAIYDFHVHGNGWCDVGYNFFVDRFGQIFEGRYGGIKRTTIGGHTSGFNTVSTGVAVIGDFSSSPVPAAAYNSLVELLAFKLAFHGVNPLGRSTVTVNDNSSAKWPQGTVVTLDNIQGHRDSNRTSCPGQHLYDLLPQLRQDVNRVITERNLQPAFTLGRLAAGDRYATAAAIGRNAFSTSAMAFVAKGDGENGFADALAANYVAGLVRAPVLLASSDAVPESTLDALDALGTEAVQVLGGTTALSPAVQSTLAGRGLEVTRVAGANRYETAANIARGPGAGAIGVNESGRRTAILSSGTNFADALAAGAIVYGMHFPQLLTEPSRLPAATSAAIRDLGIQHVIITGGPAAISQGMEVQLLALGATSERIAGATRYDTAIGLANKAIGQFGYTATHLDFATGESFPDALAGGGHAGNVRIPLLLTPSAGPTPSLCSFLQAHQAANTAGGTILGGRSAVKSSAKWALQECLHPG